jgi:hypothetical protein
MCVGIGVFFIILALDRSQVLPPYS